MSPAVHVVDEIDWKQLTDAEFARLALMQAEGWLSAPAIEVRLLADLDDELLQRLDRQRAVRRRGGTSAADIQDLRPLCYMLLLAMDRVCDAGEARTVVSRALRMAGLHALLGLMASDAIAAPTWSHAHRMFARAEAAGDIALQSDLGASNQALYLRLLLLSTLNPGSLTPRQLDKTFDWLGRWSQDIDIERDLDPARHYFAVDLKGNAGLVAVDPQVAQSEPRYFAHTRLAERVAAARTDYFREISVTTLGLYATNPLFEYHDALNQLSRYWEYVGVRHSGRSSDRTRIEEVKVRAISGFEACLRAVADGDGGDAWTLTDLSPTGAGFHVTPPAGRVEKDSLVVFADPGRAAWVLGSAARVGEAARSTVVGIRRLSNEWRLVRLSKEGAADASTEPLHGFFIFGDEARGLADSIVLAAGSFDPSRVYGIDPGRDVFKIRMSRVIQSGCDWERVGFDALKRLKV